MVVRVVMTLVPTSAHNIFERSAQSVDFVNTLPRLIQHAAPNGSPSRLFHTPTIYRGRRFIIHRLLQRLQESTQLRPQLL